MATIEGDCIRNRRGRLVRVLFCVHFASRNDVCVPLEYETMCKAIPGGGAGHCWRRMMEKRICDGVLFELVVGSTANLDEWQWRDILEAGGVQHCGTGCRCGAGQVVIHNLPWRCEERMLLDWEKTERCSNGESVGGWTDVRQVLGSSANQDCDEKMPLADAP
jgi:hypothetical protein